MEQNTNDKHFSNSIFIIPVDDNYSFNKSRLSSANKPSYQLTSKTIFTDNHPHRIQSYLNYYKTYYINQVQIGTSTHFVSSDTKPAHRRYIAVPSILNTPFK